MCLFLFIYLFMWIFYISLSSPPSLFCLAFSPPFSYLCFFSLFVSLFLSLYIALASPNTSLSYLISFFLPFLSLPSFVLSSSSCVNGCWCFIFCFFVTLLQCFFVCISLLFHYFSLVCLLSGFLLGWCG